jgi:hypothetical protein
MAVVLALLAAATQPAVAQRLPAMRDGGAEYVDAKALARSLGIVASEDATSLTLRAQTGILTLFAGSPDVLWQPAGASFAREESVSAPIIEREGQWWLPLDALPLLGLHVNGDEVEGPDNVHLRLAFAPQQQQLSPEFGAELVDLGAGVPGIRLFASGGAGPASQSLLLADVGLLGLALPEQRERFDELATKAGRDHPLLLLLTAIEAGPWESVITFSQAGRSAEARYPFRLRILEGADDVVGPQSPVVAVVLLPEAFNLRQPIRVEWGEASATVTFRR